MKILVAGDFLVSWREEAWVNAFKVHGHSVNSLCINRFKSDSFPLVNKFINKLAFLVNFKNSINKNFVNDCLKNNYDLIFLSRPILITKKSIKEIKQNTKSIIVLYQNDSMFEKADSILWRYIKACIPLYDICLIYRESDRKYYERLKAQKILIVLPFYVPELHIFNPEIEKDVFVGFYGHFENDKRLSIAKSILLNPNLKNNASFRGSGWKNKLIKYKKDSNFSRVIGKEYVNQINKTWISLGIYSTLNRDNYSRRTFEIPMCGSVLMSEKNEFIARNFIEDREALFFFSKEDLIEKLIYYQSNKHKLKEIANNGKKKIISLNGSIHDRAFEILKNL